MVYFEHRGTSKIRDYSEKLFKIKNEVGGEEKANSKLRKEHLTLPKWKNHYGKTTSEYRTFKEFNNLPKEIKEITTYSKLKRELKNLFGVN